MRLVAVKPFMPLGKVWQDCDFLGYTRGDFSWYTRCDFLGYTRCFFWYTRICNSVSAFHMLQLHVSVMSVPTFALRSEADQGTRHKLEDFLECMYGTEDHHRSES
jgi:hypothetical protein